MTAILRRYQRAKIRTCQPRTRAGSWSYLIDTGDDADRWSMVSYKTEKEALEAGENSRQVMLAHLRDCLIDRVPG